MGSRSGTRSRRGLTAITAATLALIPSGCTSNEAEPAPNTSRTTEAPAPPVEEFERLTQRAAQAVTCMMTSEKTELVPASSDGGLVSIPGLPAAILQARKSIFPQESVGIWRASWSEAFTPSTGRSSIVDAEGFIPVESAYWSEQQLTPETVQAGVDDMKGTHLSIIIDSDGEGDFGITEISYMNSSAAERDPKSLSTPNSDGSRRPVTQEDVQELGEKLETALGILMSESQITDCGVNS